MHGRLVRRSGDCVQVVLPKALKPSIYQHLHVEMGHLGTDRVVEMARQRVYWPGMYSDIDEFIHQKCPCIAQRKPAREKYAPLHSIHTSSPMEMVAMDYLHLETSSGGYEYILLIVDHFTRYAQAYPTRNKSAATAAKHLYGDYVLRFGLPSKLLHDQGREFENNLFKELHRLSGIEKCRTTPYHPQTNGMVERMNRTLLQMLRTLGEADKSKWHLSLNKVIHAYNSTRHDVTGFSPHYLLFGREPRLPLDFLLDNVDKNEDITHSKYAQEWQRRMTGAYQIAREHSEKKKSRAQLRHDNRPLSGQLMVGDRVLVKNVSERGGPGKLRAYWEQKIYVVTEVKDNGVVYTVKPETEPQGRSRTVHRNLLMACPQLVVDTAPNILPTRTNVQTKDESSQRIHNTRSKTKARQKANKLQTEVRVDQSKDSQDGDDREAEGVNPGALEAVSKLVRHIEQTNLSPVAAPFIPQPTPVDFDVQLSPAACDKEEGQPDKCEKIVDPEHLQDHPPEGEKSGEEDELEMSRKSQEAALTTEGEERTEEEMDVTESEVADDSSSSENDRIDDADKSETGEVEVGSDRDLDVAEDSEDDSLQRGMGMSFESPGDEDEI